MSEFFKALKQAERDHVLQEQAARQAAAPAAASPARDEPTAVEPETVAVGPPPTDNLPTSPYRRARPSRPRAEPRPVDGIEDGLSGLDGHLVSLVTPATFAAEQYRTLRQMIEQRHATDGLSVVAVSSPSVGDGKTTTAINLAGTLAQSPNAKVLLVDGDVRRPSIADNLGLRVTQGPGLVGIILDPRLTLADAVRRRPPCNLEILPAGDAVATPYELLRSPRLGGIILEARQRYDYIVLDTPPLVTVPDCRVIAGCIDGFLVVVAAHRTPRRLVEEALDVVEPARMIGLVFNRDDRPLSRYYGYPYGGYAKPNGHPTWRWGRR